MEIKSSNKDLKFIFIFIFINNNIFVLSLAFGQQPRTIWSNGSGVASSEGDGVAFRARYRSFPEGFLRLLQWRNPSSSSRPPPPPFRSVPANRRPTPSLGCVFRLPLFLLFSQLFEDLISWLSY